MTLPMFQVDAFSGRLFSGNPAAVCPLENWPDDALLQAIAAENNLSETAFFVPQSQGFHLRWFTPNQEVDLCGHATLATAHTLFTELNYSRAEIVFFTRSGELKVTRSGDTLTMDFPALSCAPCDPPQMLATALGKQPLAVFRGMDYLAVFEHERDIQSMNPDFRLLKQLDSRAVGVTAPGTEVDFVSRFFAPKVGIDEDPVTGSFHCLLAPFWTRRLNKTKLSARQLSRRGGELLCETVNDRVLLTGQCVTYIKAQLCL